MSVPLNWSLPLKQWNIAPRVPPEHLAQFPDCAPTLIQLLYNRGVSEPAHVDAFLSDDGSLKSDPRLLRDVDVAVARVVDAIARGESIAVYGDFDVDGITGAVLLHEVLESLGGRVVPYIPHRVEEGYGLNCNALSTLRQQGVSLVISVDCGVGAAREISFGKEIGLDVIVVDHHQVPQVSTKAVAVVDPRREDCSYPFKDLAAVGVAFRLAQVLLRSCWLPGDPRIRDIEERLLDLVALGTVADVVPLMGENRQLVRQGLVALNRTRRLGLRAMIEMAGLRPGCIGTGAIGYILGPRLNAAGRLYDAVASYRLLTTRMNNEAYELAQYLEKTNQERQQLTDEAVRRAREVIIGKDEMPKLLVVSGPEYRAGIVGLVAGRLVEEFYRPAVVIEFGQQESRGSARSIAELNITHLLHKCGDLLTRFGGHARAAGFALPTANLPQFETRLQEIAEGELAGVELHPRLPVDCELRPRQISWDTYHLVEVMAPFGFGNPVPTFLTRNLWVADARRVGKDSPHLKLRLTDGRGWYGAIGFHLGQLADFVSRKRIDVVYTLESNEWNGNVALQMNVKDFRIATDDS